MSKSIIEAYTFADKSGKSITMFGILDSETPYLANGHANGLSFGAKKAALLLDILATNPQMLIDELRAYLNLSAETPAPAPKVATLPPAHKVATPAPIPVPTPVKPQAPAPAPAPATDKPIKTSVLGKGKNARTYGLFPDGSTRVYQEIEGRKPFWKKAQIAITWGEPSNAPAPAPAPIPTPVKPAPAPAAPAKPAPIDKPILREIIDGDTIVVLYLDGTYKLHNMAIA